MEQLRRLLRSLTLKQKISMAAAALIAGTALYAFSHWRKESDFKPLYTNLLPEDAGAVVEKLRELGAEYRVADSGGTVLARSARVAELRLEMARSQLPRAGRIGFELFDKSNLGATEFAEQVNYRRALEGELERSVAELADVEQARVHLTFPKDSVFLESRAPAKGSVLLRLRRGARMQPQNIAAITHLVSSAVEGLTPETVSVMDMQGNLLNRPRKPLTAESGEASDAMIEYRQQVERDLLRKIEATLEPLLGAERYRAAVSVDCDFTSGEQSEEILDPTKSVMLTSQRTEDSSAGLVSAGVPGTASSLPRPAPRTTGATGGLSRKTENMTYQSSRTVRRTRTPQGSVKRVSVSVLLDQELRWEKQDKSVRRVLEPPSPEKIKTIRDVVAGIVNLQPDRGDQVIVETLPFDSTLRSKPPDSEAPPAAPATRWQVPLEYRRVVTIGAAAAGALIAMSFILYRKLRRRRKKAPEVSLEAGPQLEATSPSAAPDLDGMIQEQIAAHQAERDRAEADILSKLKLQAPKTEKAEVLSRHLRDLVKKDPAIPVDILHRWISG